jgi:hypothetical protein
VRAALEVETEMNVRFETGLDPRPTEVFEVWAMSRTDYEIETYESDNSNDYYACKKVLFLHY